MKTITGIEYDDKEFEIREIAKMELDTFNPDEILIQVINWIYTLDIPVEDMIEIEAGIRQQYRLNPEMFNLKEGES